MENNNIIIEEYEDALSLCDFALCDQESIESSNTTTDSSQEDLFEFSTSSTSSEPNSATNHNNNNIIFCGKIISCKTENYDDDDYHQRNNHPLRSPSSPSPRLLKKNKISSNNSSSNLAALPPQARSSSKKQKVIIGLAKIPSKMELSDLRERQNRKQTAPPPMFPAVVGSEASAVSGNRSSKKSHNRCLLRPFRFRAQGNASMLTRSSSLGCLRLARPCVD